MDPSAATFDSAFVVAIAIGLTSGAPVKLLIHNFLRIHVQLVQLSDIENQKRIKVRKTY